MVGTYNSPPNNFLGLSWDKTDHVIQNQTMVIRHPLFDLIFVVRKWGSVQATLLFRQYFLQKPVTEKSKAGWQFHTKKQEKILKIYGNELRVFVLRNYLGDCKINKPLFQLADILEENASSWKIVLKISQLPSKPRFSTNCSCFGQSFSLGHYPPIYQLPKGLDLLNNHPHVRTSYQRDCLAFFSKCRRPNAWIPRPLKFINELSIQRKKGCLSFNQMRISSIPQLHGLVGRCDQVTSGYCSLHERQILQS